MPRNRMRAVSVSIDPTSACVWRDGLGGSAGGILSLGVCFRGFARNDAVDPLAVDLLGLERETELLAHDAGEEATHGVLLPAGRLHDRRNCRSLGLVQ